MPAPCCYSILLNSKKCGTDVVAAIFYTIQKVMSLVITFRINIKWAFQISAVSWIYCCKPKLKGSRLWFKQANKLTNIRACLEEAGDPHANSRSWVLTWLQERLPHLPIRTTATLIFLKEKEGRKLGSQVDKICWDQLLCMKCVIYISVWQCSG